MSEWVVGQPIYIALYSIMLIIFTLEAVSMRLGASARTVHLLGTLGFLVLFYYQYKKRWIYGVICIGILTLVNLVLALMP